MSRSPSKPATQPPRITPRNSEGEDVSGVSVETPWQTLHQLGKIARPTTPLRRASSAGPVSNKRQTPAGQARTPGTGRRVGGSARRPVAVTPHGRAAQRELELRRVGLTPGRDRRRSGRQQKDTPRDTLRALSRILAPKSLPVLPTPQGQERSHPKSRDDGEDDLDDEVELQRPRLSLPLEGEDDEDDSLLLPPKSAGLEDENFTAHSIEAARRAISEQPAGRLSRGSFGSIRMSDAFTDLNGLGTPGAGDISSFLAGGTFQDDEIQNMADESALPVEYTATLRNIGFSDGAQLVSASRQSDIRPTQLPGDETETTFVFNVPQREALQDIPVVSSPALGPSPKDEELEQDGEDRGGDDKEDSLVLMTDREEKLASNSKTQSDDTSMMDTTAEIVPLNKKNGGQRKMKVQMSKHGIPYPSLPTGIVKKLASKFAKTAGNSKAKINQDTLGAIMQATDWFFTQVGDDLGAYAKHGGRKTIDESDIMTLMARQRQTNATTTPFSLAQKHLPRELLQEMRMVPPSKLERGRQLDRIVEADEG